MDNQVKFTISADNRHAEQALKQTARSFADLKREADGAFAGFGRSSSGAQQAQQRFQQAAESFRQSVVRQNAALEELSMRAMPQQQQAVARLQKSYGGLISEVDAFHKQGLITGQRAGELKAALGDRLSEAIARTTENTRSLGTTLSTVNARWTMLVALAASASVVVKASMDTTLAADRMRVALESAAGSAANAAKEQAFLRAESERLGLVFLEQGKAYALLASAGTNAGLSLDQMRKVWQAAVTAGKAFQLTQADMNGVLLAFSQVLSKGKVQAEELRGQIGERIPGAFAIAARAMGVTTQELSRMMEAGELLSNDFIPKFAAQLEKELGEKGAKAALGLQSAIDRLKTEWGELVTMTPKTEAFFRAIVDGAANAVDVVDKMILKMWGLVEASENAYVGGAPDLDNASDAELRAWRERRRGSLGARTEADAGLAGEREALKRSILGGNDARLLDFTDRDLFPQTWKGEFSSEKLIAARKKIFEEIVKPANQFDTQQQQQAYEKAQREAEKAADRAVKDAEHLAGRLNDIAVDAERKRARAAEEAAEEERKLQQELAQISERLTLERLSKEERAVEQVRREYAGYMVDLVRIREAGMDEAQVAELRADLMMRQAEAIGEVERRQQEAANKTLSAWSHTFERLEDITADWFYEWDISLDSLTDLFRKSVAQMVSSWLWGQAQMAMTGGVSGGWAAAGRGAVAAGGGFSPLSLAGLGYQGLTGGLSSAGYGLAGGYLNSLGELAQFYGASGGSLESAGFALSGFAKAFPALSGGLTAGLGTFLLSGIMGGDWGAAARQGAGAGAGAALGTAILPGIGTVIGAVGGSLLGGMFGDDDDGKPFELWRMTGGGMTDTSWNRGSGFDATNWQHPLNKWGYEKIANAYLRQTEQIQEQFDQAVTAQLAAIPQDIQEQILARLEATDYAKLLNDAAGGTWRSTNADEALRSSAEKYAAALTATLASAIGEYYGAEVQAALARDAAQKAAKAPITEMLARSGLDDYGLALRDLDQQFDAFRETLQAAGVDLAAYTDLQKAYDIEWTTIQEERIAAAQSVLNDAAAAYRSGLERELATLQNNVNSARGRYVALLAEETGTLRSAATSLGSARQSLADNLVGQDRGLQSAAFSRLASLAMNGDREAMGGLGAAGTDYISAVRATATDWRDVARQTGKVLNTLAEAEKYAGEQADDLERIRAAVEGQNEQAMTIDAARRQYEDATLALQTSGFQQEIDRLDAIHGTLQESLDVLRDRYLEAQENVRRAEAPLAARDAMAGRTLVQQVAVLYETGLNRLPDNAGLQYWLDEATRLGSVDAIKEAFFNAAAINGEQTIRRFSTGGSFMVGGPGGVDNLALPGLRVTAGEMVHVSRGDAMGALAAEIAALRADLSAVLVAIAGHTEKTASVMRRFDGNDGLLVRAVA